MCPAPGLLNLSSAAAQERGGALPLDERGERYALSLDGEADALNTCGTAECEILGPPRYGSLPDHVRDALSRERARVTGLQPADPAAVAAAGWIEVVVELPWRRAEERPGAPAALRPVFDREHVGRDREKDQVIDHLVARRAAARRHAAGAPADDAVLVSLASRPRQPSP